MIICEHGTRENNESCPVCELEVVIERRRDMVWAAGFVSSLELGSVGAWAGANLVLGGFDVEGERRLKEAHERSTPRVKR